MSTPVDPVVKPDQSEESATEAKRRRVEGEESSEVQNERVVAGNASVTNGKLTEDEFNLYDRQIRLWGVEAQKKLRKCNVLIIGLNGTGSEILKTLMLAGVNSIRVWDTEKCTRMDLLNNIFLTHNDLGKNRATAALNVITILNPMVKVTVEEKDITSLLEEKQELESNLKRVDVVILNQTSRDVATKLNTACRSIADRKIYFYWSCDWGYFGMAFVDLQKGHKYLVEELIKNEKKGDDVKTMVKEKAVVNHELDYISLDQALSVKAGKAGVGLTKRTNPVFIMIHILLEFQNQKGHFPKNRAEDSTELQKTSKEVIEKLGVDESILDKATEKWWNYVYGSRNAVSTILGSSVGQDVVRAVTGKEETFKNFILLDGCKGTVYIEQVGK